ncbi:MAG: glycosyltransferase family A protein, partial [Vicinamibacterales bacterium]
MTSHNDDTVNEVVFSVVIPTYNHAELLRGALETVCRQAFDERRYEVIVVDNNSTDHTRSVVEAFATRH